jgi:hypothetical protein
MSITRFGSNRVKQLLKQITAVISLVAIIGPLLPTVTFAQDVTPGTDSGVSSITQPSDAPASSDAPAPSESAAPSGLDFNINPNGSSPSVSPDNSSLSPLAPVISPETSPATPSVSPDTPPPPASLPPVTNQVFASQTPQPKEINQNTGGYSYSYPFSVPPGRNNVQPDVKLTYQTDDTDLHSLFGEGWSISIPYIQRENKNGVR